MPTPTTRQQILAEQKTDLALLKQGGNEDGTFGERGMAVLRERMFTRAGQFLQECGAAEIQTARRLTAMALEGAEKA